MSLGKLDHTRTYNKAFTKRIEHTRQKSQVLPEFMDNAEPNYLVSLDLYLLF